MEIKKVKIEVDEQQARVILKALDLYGRIHMGQLDEIYSVLRNDGKDMGVGRNEFEYEFCKLKKLLFPELEHRYSYHAIGGNIPEGPKVAYDMIQVIRNKMAWATHDGKEMPWTVDYDPPLKVSEKTDLCECEVETDG